MRNLSQFFTKQTLSYLVYLPKVFFVLKQPIHFLKSYITRTLSIERLDLRNGLMYEIANFDDLGVFYEIFIKREYGRIPQWKINIIDIGANNGLFMLYAKSQNPHAIVHCYEPVPACAKHVAHTAYINNMSDVHVHEIAVSSAKGQQQLFLGTQTVAASLYEGIASGSEAISIETDTFASILSDNNMSSVEFVKVDCEGWEYDIFYNTPAEVLNKCKYMAIEYHDIDQHKNGRALHRHLQQVLRGRKVLYHHHPAHPHNGFITVK